MKKKLVATLLLTAVVFSGCQNTPDTTVTETYESPDTSIPTTESEETEQETYVTGTPYKEYLDIHIINATYTPNEVYFKEIRYCRSENEDQDHSVFLDISRQKIDYIVSYLETADVPDTFRRTGDGLLSPDDYEGHTYLGQVIIDYHAYDKDEPGRPASEVKSFAIEIFDEFPEGYQEFIDTINEDCGEEPIILGEPMKWSTDLYMKLSTFTDEMVNDGTVEDFLKLYPYDVYSLMNELATNSGYIEDENGIEEKDHYLFDDDIIMYYWPFFRALPREIQSVESTDEEYRKFAENVAARFGLDKSMVHETQSGDIYIENLDVTIYKSTAKLLFKYEQEERGTYYLVDKTIYDGGELVKDDIRTFFYSSDGKFIIMLNGSYMKSYYGNVLDYTYMMDFATTCGDLIAVYG